MELAEAKARLAATEDARYLEWKAAIASAERAEAALAAVPVAAIGRCEKIARYLLAQTGRGAGGPAVDDFLAIQAWLATRPVVQP